MMDIPFESFANLVFRLAHPPRSKSSQKPLPPTKIFTSWLNHLARLFPPATGKHLFRLLFPHEGSRRRYGLKETKLAIELERLLGAGGLRKWDAVGWGHEGTGCLGKEVQRAMRDRIPHGAKSTLSIAEVDRLLDQLAAHSPFSHLSQNPSSSLTQSQILSILFRESNMSSFALCLLTQIILRDLRPLLNPLPTLRVRNPTAMLRMKSNTGPAQLDLIPAMRCWNPSMVEMYLGGQGNLDWCADNAGNMDADAVWTHIGPVVGVNVQIPKCMKGRSLEDALKEFGRRPGTAAPKEVWAETKYDGYRMQIHVEVAQDGEPNIRAFSKSKRDSTDDRLNTHAIIHAALGLAVPLTLPAHPALFTRLIADRSPKRHTIRSVILEAEVVPYNEGQREGGRGPGVEEFWWLGAAGVTAGDRSGQSLLRDHHRHLCLYFFDILYLNGENLLNKRLDERRRLLEQTIRVIPGFSQLAEYSIIDMSSGQELARDSLRIAFDRSEARREEGLVLKAPESTYLDSRWRWVKLKKDYIPDLGDCIDLVLLGAGWDMDRARDLRVDTSVFTTFYIGVLTNQSRVKAKIETPHFEILFRVSYGPDRDVLEVINQNIRHGRWRSKPYDKDDPYKRRLLGLSWTYVIPREMTPPSVLFEQPLCAEIMGAGFQKSVGSDLYELRWPRLQKIYDARERSWAEALTSEGLLQVAHRSLGYSTTPKLVTSSPKGSPQDDSIRALWRSSSAAALTDIPEFPTPSPERPSPRRMQSAPDILSGLKSSPPSPVSPQKVRRRLFQVMEGENEIETDLAGIILSPKRRKLVSPLGNTEESISSNNCAHLGDLGQNTSPRFAQYQVNQIIIPDSQPRPGSSPLAKVASWKVGRRLRAKPLSLRSRIRMALSRMRSVSVRA